MTWYTFVIAFMLNFQHYELFPSVEGLPVYMRTEQFRAGIGNFQTLAACQAFTPADPEEFVFIPKDGIEVDYLLHNAQGAPLTPGMYNVVGCTKVNGAAQ